LDIDSRKSGVSVSATLPAVVRNGLSEESCDLCVIETRF